MGNRMNWALAKKRGKVNEEARNPDLFPSVPESAWLHDARHKAYLKWADKLPPELREKIIATAGTQEGIALRVHQALGWKDTEVRKKQSDVQGIIDCILNSEQ